MLINVNSTNTINTHVSRRKAETDSIRDLESRSVGFHSRTRSSQHPQGDGRTQTCQRHISLKRTLQVVKCCSFTSINQCLSPTGSGTARQRLGEMTLLLKQII